MIARSPNLGEVRVLNATKLAEEPEFTVIQYLTPKKAANFCSKAALNRPVVSQASKEAATIFWSSCSPITFPEGGITVFPASKGWGL